MIRQVLAAGGSPRDQNLRLTGLAEVIASKGGKREAYELGRRVLLNSGSDPEIVTSVRRVLARLIPSYHISMMNDSCRNATWDQALRKAIKPGIRAFEIGTGGGLLALMAARAGATVYTCEDDPVVADVAAEIFRLNGLEDRITLLRKRSHDVTPPDGNRFDLLLCDIFTDSLLGFDPLGAIADAHSRLLKPDATIMPHTGVVRIALANWPEYSRLGQIKNSVGFDLEPMSAFIPEVFRVGIADPSLTLMSDAQDLFRFNLTQPIQPRGGNATAELRTIKSGQANGIAQWICLHLDDETVIESNPQSETVSFSSPLFYPLPNEVSVRAEEIVNLRGRHDGRRLTLWVNGSSDQED